MIIKCPECGHQVSDQAETCPSCGIRIAGKITRCPDCGEIIFKEQAVCPNCHCTINGTQPAPDPIEPEVSAAPVVQEEPETPSPAPKRRPKAGYIALLVAFVIALIVVFLGIYFYRDVERQNTQRAYENAIGSDQPAVLQNFLDMYPDATRSMKDSIEAHLTLLKKADSEWAKAVASGQKAELEKYIARHPHSIHNVEAKLRIDSIDWESAKAAGTADAMKAYLEQHENGQYYDEAHNLYEHLEAQRITGEDQQMTAQLLTAYFTALGQRDEAALSATIEPVLTSFLRQENSTKADVILYMNQMFEPDVSAITFTPNNDWNIEKHEDSNGQFSFAVTCTVRKQIERSDEEKEHSATYKVNARISPEGRISAINMKPIVK